MCNTAYMLLSFTFNFQLSFPRSSNLRDSSITLSLPWSFQNLCKSHTPKCLFLFPSNKNLCNISSVLSMLYFKKDFIYLFLEREKGGRKSGSEILIWERNIHWLVASCTCPLQGLNPQPRHVPWPESNWQPFSLQIDAQPTEPHHGGPFYTVLKQIY